MKNIPGATPLSLVDGFQPPSPLKNPHKSATQTPIQFEMKNLSENIVDPPLQFLSSPFIDLQLSYFFPC